MPRKRQSTSSPKASSPAGGVPPLPSWGDSLKTFAANLRKRLGAEGVILGVINPQRFRSDELLVCDRFSPDAVAQWVAADHKSDQLFKIALKQGSATGPASEAGGWAAPRDAGKKVFLAYQAIPDAHLQKRVWIAVVSRSKGEFTDAEMNLFSLLMRQWIAHFNRPRESKMMRILIGHDDRIIHADPVAEQKFIDMDIAVKRVMSEVRETVLQRWPKFQDDELHDVVFSVGKDPMWLRLKRQRALPGETSESWYIELRPLDPGEMQPTGVVADDRIGEALGYMHDRYNRSPGLNEVANAVHISPFHFHRLFSRLVGVTPKQYVLQKQIQMAKWMLRSRKVPISRIAVETGFASHGHFTSTFRRMIKLSPTEYRDQAEM